jgi:hypothetical protein
VKKIVDEQALVTCAEEYEEVRTGTAADVS